MVSIKFRCKLSVLSILKFIKVLSDIEVIRLSSMSQNKLEIVYFLVILRIVEAVSLKDKPKSKSFSFIKFLKMGSVTVTNMLSSNLKTNKLN